MPTKNWLSKLGAWLSHLLVFKGFGVASVLLAGLLGLSGLSVLANTPKQRLYRHWVWGTFIIIWLSIGFGFIFKSYPNLGGTIGYELNLFFQV